MMTMTKLGMSFMQFEHVVDWEEVASIRPKLLLIMDPHHYLDARRVVGEDGIVIWRPSEPSKPLWNRYSGIEWANVVFSRWPYQTWPDYVQFLNEPNTMEENGVGDGDLAVIPIMRQFTSLFTARWFSLGHKSRLITPPMSPAHDCRDFEFLEALRPEINAICNNGGVLGVHCYWATPAGLYNPVYRVDEALRFIRYQNMFPHDIIITEFNRPAHGEERYGQEIYDYAEWFEEDDAVLGGAIFVYQSIPGLFQEYEMRGTPAMAKLARLQHGSSNVVECPVCGSIFRLVEF